MLAAPVTQRSAGAAFGLSSALLRECVAQGRPFASASVVEGPCVVLGAGQERAFAVDEAWLGRLGAGCLRRRSSGTTWFLPPEGAVHLALALPTVSSVQPDATLRTLLNRNVRGWLAGSTRAGLLGQYFGRDWIAVHHRPCWLLGYEVSPEGAVLLEALAGVEQCSVLPEEGLPALLRGVERNLGKAGISLVEAGMKGDPLRVCRLVLEGAARRWTLELEERAVQGEDAPLAEAADPSGWRVGACGAGLVYARQRALALRVGGDMLAPSGALSSLASALHRRESADPEALGVLGLRWEELLAAWDS